MIMTYSVHVDYDGQFMPTYGILSAVTLIAALIGAALAITWKYRRDKHRSTPLAVRVLAVVLGVTAGVGMFGTMLFALSLITGQIDQTEAAIESTVGATLVHGLPNGRYVPDPPYTITLSRGEGAFDCQVTYVKDETEYADLQVTCAQ